MQDILLTICARGGSKGVKNKNIRLLDNRPLIAHTINQAKSWGKATRIVISTDSEDIAKVGRLYGVDVPFLRSADLASDSAGKVAAIRDALIRAEDNYNEKYPIIMDLDVTAPIRTIHDLDNCLEKFTTSNCDTLFSVVKSHKNPYFNMIEELKPGEYGLCKGAEATFLRRQDLPDVFSLNASIYLYDREYLLDENNVSPINPKCSIYVMDDVSGTDIDREIDFKYIEYLIKEKVVSL